MFLMPVPLPLLMDRWVPLTFYFSCFFFRNEQYPYGGHMVAAMAMMEAPAIVVGMIPHS